MNCDCCNKSFETKTKLVSHIYYMKNKEKVYLCHRNYQLNHKEKTKELMSNWYKKVKDTSEYINKSKQYYIDTKETKREYRISICKKHREENPELYASYRNNRRDALNMFSKTTVEIIQQVYENNIKKYGTLTCCLCFKPIKFGEDSLEHLIPLCRHEEFLGKDLNALDNLDIAHLSCNCSKSYKTLEEWFKEKHQLLENKK